MSDEPFERYLRHGRRYEVDEAFWETAARDLGTRDLRRLAAELGARLPRRWSTSRSRGPQLAPEARSTANKPRSDPRC